jgi:aspartate racemase
LKTIGVLGGIGPQATMEFERRLHRVAQRLLPQRGNTGYPPMVVHYHRRPPFVMGDMWKPRLPWEVDPEFLSAAKRLGAIADFLVITSNTTHLFRDDIERAAERPVLSMIELTLDEVQRRGWRRVGVIGFGEPTVYTIAMKERGLHAETIKDPDEQRLLDRAIVHVMEGREDADGAAAARDAIAEVRGGAVDGIILGCTEIPLLLENEARAADCLDPLDYLAEGAVREAMAP